MRSPVRISDLRHRVRIESPVRASDGVGGAILTWSLFREVWAAIWPRSADEGFAGNRIAGKASHDIWIRKLDGVKPEMRIVSDTRVFNILGVIDVEDRGRFYRCPSEERDL